MCEVRLTGPVRKAPCGTTNVPPPASSTVAMACFAKSAEHSVLFDLLRYDALDTWDAASHIRAHIQRSTLRNAAVLSVALSPTAPNSVRLNVLPSRPPNRDRGSDCSSHEARR